MQRMDPSELIAKQQAYEGQKARKQAEQERKQREEEGLKSKTGSLAQERLNQLEATKNASDELARHRADNIERKIAQAEENKADIEKWRQDLDETVAELKEAESWMQRTREALGLEKDESIEGRDLAAEVASSLAAAEEEMRELRRKARELEKDIKNTKEQMVDDETVANYQDLIRQVDSLNQRIEEIEANPHVIELLYSEAKDEDGVRDQLADCLVGTRSSHYPEPETGSPLGKERQDYLRTLAQKFFQEELDRAGINNIENPQERISKMRELAESMTTAMRNPGDTSEKLGRSYDITKEKRAHQGAGVALMNLAGKFGTAGDIVFISDGRGEERDIPDSLLEQKVLARTAARVEAAIDHIGSINYALANADGWGPLSRKITTLGRYTEDPPSSELRKELGKLGFDETSDGIMVPLVEYSTGQPKAAGEEKPVSAAKIEGLRRERRRYLDQAAQRVGEHIAREERELQDLNDEIAKLNRDKTLAEQYQAELEAIRKDARVAEGIGITRLTEHLETTKGHLEGTINLIEQRLEEESQQRHGLLDRQGKRESAERKKSHQSELAGKRRELDGVQSRIERLRQLQGKYPDLQKTNPLKIAEEIARKESDAGEDRINLDALKKAVAKERERE